VTHLFVSQSIEPVKQLLLLTSDWLQKLVVI